MLPRKSALYKKEVNETLKWKQIIKELSIIQDYVVSIYCNNYNVIRLTNNPVYHEQTKHVILHFLKNVVEYQIVNIMKITSKR